MKQTLVLASALLLASCASDGTLNPQARVAISVLCSVDQAAPALVVTGTTIGAIVAPEAAPALLMANKVDALAHPAVQAACSQALAGSVPKSLTISVAPQ